MKHRKMNRKYIWKNSGEGWLKKHWKKITLISVLSVSLLTASVGTGLAAGRGNRGGGFGGFGGGFGGGMMGQSSEAVMAENPGEIVTSTVENKALSLEADLENVTRIQMTDSDNKVKIEEAGTYVVTGDCADGSITVKKGATGVVLVLENLTLSSSEGAALSINKEAQAKIVISGSVTLTDNEDPSDEKSADTETANAFDGAAIKAKAGSQVALTGDGTLTVNGKAKNGIKVGEKDSSFIVDGEGLTVSITAANDGINAGADLTILSGTVNVTANDDAIHADRILTIGDRETAKGPSITVNAAEGLEATVVNIFGGDVQVTAANDAINGTQKVEDLTASVNITGGTITLESRSDGLDCNGNVNLLGGTITISSASFGGEAGIDYDGAYYVADAVTLNNNSGVAGPDGGGMGGFGRGGWDRDGQGQQFPQEQNGQGFQPGQFPQDGNFPQGNPPMQPFGMNQQPDLNSSATVQQREESGKNR